MKIRKEFFELFCEVCSVNWKRNFISFVNENGVEISKITFGDLDLLTDGINEFLRNYVDNNSSIGIFTISNFHFPLLAVAILKSKCCFGAVKEFNERLFDYVITSYSIEECAELCRLDEIEVCGLMFTLWKVPTSKHCASGVEMCYTITSSGSTGSPKIIRVPWTCILPNVKELNELFKISSSDIIFQGTNWTFDPSMVDLFVSLTTGATLVIPKHKPFITSDDLFRLSNKNVLKVTILQVTPSVFRTISFNILQEDSSLRILILGGEDCSKDLLIKKHKLNKTRIYNIYGITEISCWAMIHETDPTCVDKIELGKPLWGIEWKLTEESELLLGSKERFCLVDKEVCKTDDVVYRETGDIVSIQNGHIFYRCRKNKIVKKMGQKIDLSLLEEQIKTVLDGIKDIFITFCLKKQKVQYFLFCQENKSNEILVEKELFSDLNLTHSEEILKQSLSRFFVDNKSFEIGRPDKVFIINHIPLNSHGKVDQLYLETKSEEYMAKLNRSNDGIDVKSIWYDYLGCRKESELTDKLNMNEDGFCSLGGTSVTAIQMINSLEENLNLKVPPDLIQVLLNNGTLSQVVACVKNSKSHNIENVNTESKQIEGSLLRLVWTYDMTKCVDSTPTIYNNVVLVGSHSSKLTCLNITDGKLNWEVVLDDRIETKILCDQNLIFCGSYDHYLYCITLDAGHIVWRYKTDDVIKSSPCMSYCQACVYVGSYDHFLHAVSIKDGSLVMKVKLGNAAIYSSPILSRCNKLLYVATLDGTCVCLEDESLDVRWKHVLSSPVFCTPVLCQNDNSVLFTEVLGLVHCFNARNGTEMWNFKSDGNIYSSPSIIQNGDDNFNVIFGCHDNNVYCICETNLIWKQTCDSPIFSRCCIFQSDHFKMICVCCTNGDLKLLNFDGVLLYNYQLNGQVFSSPQYCDNRIIVGCRDNYLYCFNID